MKTENREELIQVLNDLVRINNDRIQGYETAIENSKDATNDLLNVFREMIDESREFKDDLLQTIQSLGGEADFEETTHSGKLYRFWMNVKESITDNHRETVLDDCEFGEDAAQKAYQEALESDATMDADIRRLILNQKASLKQSHDTIRRLRNNEKEFSNIQSAKSSKR
jgi:uncharacterized protein (TIGR02284 family)